MEILRDQLIQKIQRNKNKLKLLNALDLNNLDLFDIVYIEYNNNTILDIKKNISKIVCRCKEIPNIYDISKILTDTEIKLLQCFIKKQYDKIHNILLSNNNIRKLTLDELYNLKDSELIVVDIEYNNKHSILIVQKDCIVSTLNKQGINYYLLSNILNKRKDRLNEYRRFRKMFY